MKNYEGMFLFDPGVVTDWDNAQKELNRILGRAEAQLIACNVWDERRLAYEINGCKRGLYVLSYFRSDPSKIAGIERDVQLSEGALRCLIVRVDHLTEEQMAEAVQRRDHGESPRGPGEFEREGRPFSGERDRDHRDDRDRDRGRRRPEVEASDELETADSAERED